MRKPETDLPLKDRRKIAQAKWVKKNPRYSKEYYSENKEVLIELAREYRRLKPEKYLYDAAKARARKSQLEFTIEICDIVIPEFCPVFGLKLEMLSEDKNTSPSLDRVDNSKGYIPGNVRVISWKANKLKSNASLQEIEALYRYIKGEL